MREYMKMLGLKAKDRVTGFKGTVTSICFDLYGCVQVIITPDAGKDGKVGESYWYDAKRIELLSSKPVMTPPAYLDMAAGREIGAADKPGVRQAR